MPLSYFFSLPCALNYRFSFVQYLYHIEFIVYKKVLWLNVLGDIKKASTCMSTEPIFVYKRSITKDHHPDSIQVPEWWPSCICEVKE